MLRTGDKWGIVPASNPANPHVTATYRHNDRVLPEGVDPWLILTSAGVILSAVLAVARVILPPTRRLVHLLDDFAGEDPRPGLPKGRPGVMDRLAQLDGIAVANREVAEAARLLAVQASARGDELRLVADRVEEKVDDLAGRLEACGQCTPIQRQRGTP